MSVVVVLGTRPEIIKLGHLIRLLGDDAHVVHTGQHFDTGLSQVFFEAFGIAEPDTTLGVGGRTRGTQIGQAVEALSVLFQHHRPTAVVVQGDTNSTVAGAIAANAAEIPLLHVEAGLRSRDRRMPEEHNRVVADHLADRCCAPTTVNEANLLAESIPAERIVVTGNTIVEAVITLMPGAPERTSHLARHGLESDGFVLSTFHRPENVDDVPTLLSILQQLAAMPVPVLLPVHPRTKARIDGDPRLEAAARGIHMIEPLGYPEFLALAAECAILVSDSGGVQEEASIIKRPVIVVRRSTERPEVIGTFAMRVEPGEGFLDVARSWLADLPSLHSRLAAVPSPYGDGLASERIAGELRNLIDG